METEMKFKQLLTQYTGLQPENISNDMRFREDLSMSSLDFMTLLGDIEDEFDIEFEESDQVHITTVGEAIELLGRYL